MVVRPQKTKFQLMIVDNIQTLSIWANNPWRRWVESLPMKKRIALELFFFLPILILVDEYILMPYIGMAILPWNWDWSGG